MNRSTLTTLLVLLIITALAQSVVIVRDTEKAILLKLGAFERTLDQVSISKFHLLITLLSLKEDLDL